MEAKDLLENPEFQALSGAAKRVVIDKVSSEFAGFSNLSPQAQEIVRKRLIEPRVAPSTVEEPTERSYTPLEAGVEPLRRVGAGLADVGAAGAKGASNLVTDPLGLPGRLAYVDWGGIAKGFLRATPAIVGGVAGSILGPGGMVGGAMLGEAGYRAASQATGLEKPESLIENLIGTATAGAGQWLGTAAPKAAAPFASKVTPEGHMLIDLGAKAGFRPSPTDVRSAPLLQKIEGLSVRGVGGGRIAARAEQEVEAVIGKKTGAMETPGYAQKTAERLAGPRAATPTEAGQGLKDALDTYVTRIESAIQREGENLPGRMGVSPATPASRGSQVQAGLDITNRAVRLEEDMNWSAVREADTGIPDWRQNNLAKQAAELAKESGLAQSFERGGETSANLRRLGGKFVPGPEKPKSAPLTPRYDAEGNVVRHPVSGKIVKERVFNPDTKLPSGESPEGAAFVSTQTVSDPVENMITGLANNEGKMSTFLEADAFRKKLNKMYEGTKDRRLLLLKDAHDLDRGEWAMKEGANSERAIIQQKAIDQTRESVTPFKPNEPLGRLLRTKEPVAVLDAVLAPGDKNISMLRTLHKATGGEGVAWDALHGEALTRAASSKQFFGKMGPEQKTLLLSPREIGSLDELHSLPDMRAGRIANFLKRDAKDVVPSLIRNGDASYGDVVGLKKVIGGTPAWDDAVREGLYELLDKPSRIKTVGTRVRGEFFTPDQNALLSEIENWSRVSQAGQRAAKGDLRPTGVNTVSAAQTGGIILNLGRGKVGTATALLIPPVIGAQLLTRGPVAKLLSEGFRTPAGTQESARILSQLLVHYRDVTGRRLDE